MSEQTKPNENAINKWKRKVELFFSRKMAIHVRLASGQFYGGQVLRIYQDSFDIDDVQIGAYPIEYSEIVHVEKKKEVSQ